MSSEAKLDSAALAAQAAETKARIIAYWDSKINEEDGSFEAVFGDPTKTPYAARVIVYYDENEESAIAIVYEAVELGHFSEEESFTAQEDATLRILIEEAIPLMDEAVYEFARSVYDALATVDDHPSFKDSEIEKYDRLKEKEKKQREIEKEKVKEEIERKRVHSPATANKARGGNWWRNYINPQRYHPPHMVWDADSGSYISREYAEEKNKQIVSITGPRDAILKWREIYGEKESLEFACRMTNATYPIVARLMPVFEAERNPKNAATSPWTAEEEGLWDYLELVACVGQRHFQYAGSGLTRIPLAFSQLTQVEEVNLSENKLVVVPIELVSLPCLRRLFLHSNQIKVIPDMGGCVNLETLDIRDNSLMEVPTGIGQCKKLQAFDAERNKIRDFGELVQCTSLDFVNLNRNLIKTVPSELTELKKLAYLQLKNNPIVNLPPHVYIQGMAAIMDFVGSHTTLSTEVEVSSMRSDFMNLMTSAEMTDIEIVSSVPELPLEVNIPYTDAKMIAEVEPSKILELLRLNASTLPSYANSVKVHSLVLLARLPILRDRIAEALKKENAVLSLSLTPYELHVLVKYVYNDSYDAPIVPTPQLETDLGRKSSLPLNYEERETLRNSLVSQWRNTLQSTIKLSDDYKVGYLGTLASRALGIVETQSKPFALSSFMSDFKTLLPVSVARVDVPIVEHEWNTDDAMKHISEGFNELSLHKPNSVESSSDAMSMLTSSKGVPMPSSSSSSSHSASSDHRSGVTSCSFAPNDIAFRIVDEPGSPLIGAHKVVLCGRSKYLHNMLTGGLIESRQSIIELNDISYDTMKSIVEFCYTDDVTEIHGEMIMELMMKARLFGLDRLLGYVESIVGYSLDVENVTSIISVAYMYSLPRLAKATKFYVLSHWTQVTQGANWHEVDESVRNKLTSTALKWGIIGEGNQ